MLRISFSKANNSLAVNNQGENLNPFIAIDKVVKCPADYVYKLSTKAGPDNQLHQKLQNYFNKLKRNYGYIV